MGIAILLFLVFVGIEDAPGYGYSGVYPKAGPVKTYAFPPAGTTWVACMNAVSLIFPPSTNFLLGERMKY